MPVTLLFGIHAHQPLAAPALRIADAHERCYRPFLAIADAHPGFRCTAHFSGPLLAWMRANRPDDFARLVTLNRRRQVELLAAGSCAPNLAAIPHRDRIAQLRTYCEKLTQWTGRAPEGAWLTGGVWEPTVLPALAESGLRYVPIDACQFAGSGYSASELDGFFASEEDGQRLDLFPVDGELRQLLREATAAEAVAGLEALAASGRPLAIHFDALETLCERGDWLAEFMAAVLASGQIETACYGDFHNSHGARGIAYPAGGSGRAALARAPAANWLHKRMLGLSARLARLPRQPRELLDLLHRAQAHDDQAPSPAYGMESPPLRAALWQNLLGLESRLDRLDRRPAMESDDFDLDGRRETLAHGGEWQLATRDDGFGAVHELSSYGLAHNFAGTPAGAVWIDSLNGRNLTDYQPAGPLAYARAGIAKRIILIGDLISLQWRLSGLVGKTFATTLNLALSGADAAGGYLVGEEGERLPFGESLDLADASTLILADEALGGRLCIAWNEGARVAAGPCFQIVRGAEGSEKVMQSVQIRLEWDVCLPEFTIALQVTANPRTETPHAPD